MINKGLPISASFEQSNPNKNHSLNNTYSKKRAFILAVLATIIGVCVSIIAKALIYLINFITNVSFFWNFSIAHSSPTNNNLGWWVILIPAIGGLIVGLMALYGSKAIRGHGIPEAMEQILTNQSKIKPSITYLKPISAAISIGSGGPFGAEGPIIATGGALGSTIGQLLKITPNERKILLAAGATAGMAAIFGSPVAAILLAIELLLFEFSPRSFIPVAIACITGAAGHHFLFGSNVFFPLQNPIGVASNAALFFYGVMGIVVGFLSIATTKIVYRIEDTFEKLPIHWALWPAIGGVAVGVIGYFDPRTLGVGYENITDVLSGNMAISLVASLCLLKFVSWAISLGSGTSGGTLAPLLTIGGAIGALIGTLGIYLFPEAGISISLAALVGMSALFAGASRAFLTSIVFALETTGEIHAFLPLLATCTGSFLVSYFLMDNTIMTEKISRRGVFTPNSYEPDILERIRVGDTLEEEGIVISDKMKTGEVKHWVEQESELQSNYFIIATEAGEYKGLLSLSTLLNSLHQPDTEVGELVKRRGTFIRAEDNLKTAMQLMAKENVDILPIIAEQKIIGVLSFNNILSVYKENLEENEKRQVQISINRQRLKILVKGHKLVSLVKRKNSNA